jgi:hypothetical protein
MSLKTTGTAELHCPGARKFWCNVFLFKVRTNWFPISMDPWNSYPRQLFPPRQRICSAV